MDVLLWYNLLNLGETLNAGLGFLNCNFIKIYPVNRTKGIGNFKMKVITNDKIQLAPDLSYAFSKKTKFDTTVLSISSIAFFVLFPYRFIPSITLPLFSNISIFGKYFVASCF